MNRKLLLLGILSTASILLKGQKIELSNSSFEGEPRDATVPQGWMGCKEGTTPDILPGYWGVYTDPSDGNTFVGLITRQNNTWETIGQRLPDVLHQDNCYSFSLDLAHSDTYSGYNKPLQLRIYISQRKCGKEQIIFESPLIEHLDWKTYQVKFTPNQDCRYIHIEAYHHRNPVEHKGNILIDRIRPIMNCDRT